MPEKGSFKVLKALDDKRELVEKEENLGKKVEIVAGMVRDVGYSLEGHCQSDGLYRIKVSLTLGGFSAAIVALAYGLWWLIQKHMGG